MAMDIHLVVIGVVCLLLPLPSLYYLYRDLSELRVRMPRWAWAVPVIAVAEIVVSLATIYYGITDSLPTLLVPTSLVVGGMILASFDQRRRRVTSEG